MKPVETQGANQNFTPPLGWDEEKDGRCGVLSVRIEAHGERYQSFVSTWEPTAEELVALQAGARVELSCIGVQPPVALNVVQSNSVECLPGILSKI